MPGDITITKLNSTDSDVVSIDVAEDGSLVVAALSKNKSCFGYHLSDPTLFDNITEIPEQKDIVCSAKIMRSFF